MAKACLLRTVTWRKVLTSSKLLSGLCVAISKNMILKDPFRWWRFSFYDEAALESGSKTTDRQASEKKKKRKRNPKFCLDFAVSVGICIDYIILGEYLSSPLWN